MTYSSARQLDEPSGMRAVRIRSLYVSCWTRTVVLLTYSALHRSASYSATVRCYCINVFLDVAFLLLYPSVCYAVMDSNKYMTVMLSRLLSLYFIFI